MSRKGVVAALVACCLAGSPAWAVFDDVTPEPAAPAVSAPASPPASVRGAAKGAAAPEAVHVAQRGGALDRAIGQTGDPGQGSFEQWGEGVPGEVSGWGKDVPLRQAVDMLMPGWTLDARPAQLAEHKVSWRGGKGRTWAQVLDEWAQRHGWKIVADWNTKTVYVRVATDPLLSRPAGAGLAAERLDMQAFLSEPVRVFLKGVRFEHALARLLPRGWRIEISPPARRRVQGKQYDLAAEDTRGRVLADFLQHDRLSGTPYPELALFLVRTDRR